MIMNRSDNKSFEQWSEHDQLKGYLKALEEIKLLICDRLDHEVIRTQWVVDQIDNLIEEKK